MAKTKNKIKIGISLLIAMAFILPTASVFAGSVNTTQSTSEENNAGERPTIQPDSTAVQDRDGSPTPLYRNGDWEVNIVEPRMPKDVPGQHDITISIHYMGAEPYCAIGAKEVLAEIYSLETQPVENVCCYDMESVWDVYNNMNTTDSDMVIGPNGCIDTWVRSDLRAHSGTYSFHSTQFPQYLGNQHDQFFVWCCDPNIFDYDMVNIDYYRWVEGEINDLGGGYGNPLDYLDVRIVAKNAAGQVFTLWDMRNYPRTATTYTTERYITGPASWSHIVEQMRSVKNFDTIYGFTCIGLKFDWTTSPECQYEGAYIDDVCFGGYDAQEMNKVWQGYNQEPLGNFYFCEPQEYTFPLPWNAAVGCYRIHVQIHSCLPFTYTFPQVCIQDCLDLSVACPTINDPDAYENLQGTVDVSNVGNMNATNVPVTVDIYQALPELMIDDRVETGDLGYDLVNFVGTETENYWHISEFLSETPTHSWYWGIEPTDPCAPDAYHDYINMSNHGIFTPTFDLTDALGGPCVAGPDLTFDAIWNLDDTYISSLGSEDYFYGGCWFPDTGYYTFGGMYMLDNGWTTFGDWVHLGWADIIFQAPGQTYSSTTGWRYGIDQNCDGKREIGPELDDVVDFMIMAHQRGWTAVDNWQVAFGIYISSDAVRTGKDAGYPWGGMALDNFYLEVEKPSKLLQESVTNVDLCMTGFEDYPWCCDSQTEIPFEYDYMEIGKYIIKISVPDDCCNYNNMAQVGHHISAEICAPDGYYRDGMAGETDCVFHIKGSGYDNYLSAAYCGEDGQGSYANNVNSVVKSPCMDWSQDNTITITMQEWYEFENIAYYFMWPEGDFLTMWLSNNCCDEPCGTCAECDYNPDADFFQYMGFDNNAPFEDGDGDLDYWDYGAFWHTRTLTLTPADIPGGFTDTMCIMFKFVTNDRFVDVGWDLDFIEIEGDVTGPIDGPFMSDELDSMINWTCEAGITTAWSDLGQGCWEWYDPLIPGYAANQNDALVYYTDTTQAYNVDLSFDLDYVLCEDDIVYLEISKDNVTWDLVDTFEGTYAGPYTVSINKWVPGPIFIRFRATSDEVGCDGYFQVCNLVLEGMLDLRAPQTKCAIGGVYSNGKFTSDVTVTLTATDDITGVAAIYYKLDGGAQQVYSGPITVSAEGAHTVEAWAVDKVGNVETPHIQCAGFTIDKDTTAPTVTITGPSTGITIFGNTIPFGSKVIIIGGFTATATASDDSGVHHVAFYMDDVLFGESTGPTFTAYCGLKHMGAGVLKAVAYDNTGKTGTATLDVTYFKLL